MSVLLLLNLQKLEHDSSNITQLFLFHEYIKLFHKLTLLFYRALTSVAAELEEKELLYNTMLQCLAEES